MTNEKGTVNKRETLRGLPDELTQLEAEISRLRLVRERATYKLERVVRDRYRVARHLASLARNEEGAA
jgi:hypothetical protein